MKRNKVFSILLSFIIAFGLWTYVITVVSPGSDAWFYRIPIDLRGEQLLRENGLMLISKSNDTANLHFEGNRPDLAKVDSNDITLEADLSLIDAPGTHYLRYTPYYPDTLTLLERTPDTITVVIARRISREIPLNVQLKGTVATGYIADANNISIIDAQANPIPESEYTVRITGPEEVVNQIHEAYVEVDMKGRTATADETIRYTLRNAKGEPVDASLIEVTVEEVRVQVKVQMLKVIPLKLTVLDGAGATAATSKIEIDPASLRVAGSETALEGLEEINLGTVDLAKITSESWKQTYTITLPEGVTNLTGGTEATVTITFPELITKEFVVTALRPVNVPAGMEVSVETKQLTVILRGPKLQLEKLTLQDLDVTFDMTNASVGEGVYTAIVNISGQYPNVGVLQSGQISAVLAEPAPVEETAMVVSETEEIES